MSYCIFMDADGTLVNASNTICDSTLNAINQLKAKGHKLFLSTGRSIIEIQPMLFALGLDGIIAAGGGYVTYNDEVLFHQVMEVNDLRIILDYFESIHCGVALECNDGIYANHDYVTYLRNHFGNGHLDIEEYIDTFKCFNDVDLSKVNKISYLGCKDSVETLNSKFGHMFTIIGPTISLLDDDCGEITLKNVHKATGIQIILNKLGLTKNECIAIGDGSNDIEMLQLSRVGIAMGNASNQLKQIADIITDDIDDHGFYNAFKQLKLID